MSNIKGKISQVIGPVVDVHFEKGSELPSIYDALEVFKEENQSHLIAELILLKY